MTDWIEDARLDAQERAIKKIVQEHNPIKPSHYNVGGIETIDYIRAKLTKEEFNGYCKGNVLKYLSRADYKGGLEDFKKAEVYMKWLIESKSVSK